jgi:hypothetical protein
MNNDDANIFAIVVVIILIVLTLSPIIIIYAYAFYQNSRRKKIFALVLASHADLIGNNRWFPVRYASQKRFDAMFKFFPWEGAGIIVIAPTSILFLGETWAGAPVILQFAPSTSRINWLGKCPWPNGAVSWIRFDTAQEKHYFSSETGVLIFGSHGTTKAIYDEANRHFGAPAAQNL